MTGKHHVGLREAELKRQVTDWLTLKHVMWWANNTGGYKANYKGKERFIRFGKKGSPDLYALVRGTLFGIELKAHDGFQSQVQKEFEVEFTRAGGVYVLCYELGHVVTALTDAMREKL